MTGGLRFALPAYLLLETFVTLRIAASLGVGRTLLLLLLGVVAGITVLRREQLSILTRLRHTAASAEPVLPGLLDGAMRVVAAILLILPGFISDAVALALLVPWLRRRLVGHFSAAFSPGAAASVVIEGDYRRVDDRGLPQAKREH